jgi:hypothetical protein
MGRQLSQDHIRGMPVHISRHLNKRPQAPLQQLLFPDPRVHAIVFLWCQPWFIPPPFWYKIHYCPAKIRHSGSDGNEQNVCDANLYAVDSFLMSE